MHSPERLPIESLTVTQTFHKPILGSPGPKDLPLRAWRWQVSRPWGASDGKLESSCTLGGGGLSTSVLDGFGHLLGSSSEFNPPKISNLGATKTNRGQLWLHFWSKAHLFDLRHSEPRHRGRCSRMSVAQGFRWEFLKKCDVKYWSSGPLIQRWITWRWLWCHLSNSDLRKFFPPQQTSKIKQTGPSKWQECHSLHLLQGLGASII
jgi:hypothetical protein